MKKFLSFLLTVLITLLACFPFATLNTRAATQSDAVNWANSKVGKAIDMDGYPSGQPYQCVDLILSYYRYLGVSTVSGNAVNYLTNALPTGWQRITNYNGFTPKPGDIAIWDAYHSCNYCGTGQYGHIGIVVSGDSSFINVVNQNFNGNYYCTNNRFPTSAIAGYIRPNFNGSSVSTEVTVVGCDESLNCPFKIYLPANTKVELYYSENKTNYGGTINDSYGQYFESKWEIYLSDGSTEYYIYYGGKYYYMIAVDGVTAEKQHASTRWITTKQPTCKEAGIKSNVCNECGTTISTKTIEQLAHTYDDEWVVLIEPTTTNRGIKARYCWECDLPDYEEIPMLDGTINLASGKDYVTSDIYASNGVVLYPDENGVTLTDGKNAAYDAKYSDTAFVGFNTNSEDYDKNGYSSVTVDLGNIYAVDKFSTKVASSYNSVAGIYAPALVTVYVSTNNRTWVKAGSVVPTDDSSVSTVAATISLDRSVWARYVQFRFVAEVTWIFVTEVEVYEGDMIDEPIPNYISGDVNNDFTVDSLDYLLVKRACFGTYDLTDDEFARADVNADSNMDSTDYLLVKRIAFGTYTV